MPKFRYRMQNILDIKLKLEEQARNEFAQAQLRLNEEESKRDALIARKRGYEEAARAARVDSVTVKELQESEQAIHIMEEYIARQEKEVARAQAILEKKRNALQEVIKERKMHEKLREKAYDRYLKEEAAAEAKIIDELTSYTHGKK